MRSYVLSLLLFVSLFLGAAHAGTVTTTCSQPANGATLSSPVAFNCSATTTSGSVTGWKIYVDTVEKYSNPGPATSISTSVAMSAGTRSVIIKAWDSTGAVGQVNRSLTITQPAIAASCTTPITGGNYTNPIQFICTASTATGVITDWQVYQNGTLMKTWTGAGADLSVFQALTVGTNQSVVIKAWNSSGASAPINTTLTITDPVTGGGGGGGGGTGGTPEDPLASYFLTGDVSQVHDPSVIKSNGKYYLFSTDMNSTDGLKIRCSTDRVTWTLCGQVFGSVPAWVFTKFPTFGQNGQGLWDPTIYFWNGKYYLYYVASIWGSNHSVIALATNTTLDPNSPGYAWVDQGPVLESTTSDDFNALGPRITVDPSTGKYWLSFGSYMSGIHQREVNPATGMLLNTTDYQLAARPVDNPTVEGQTIWKYGSYWYMFVSFDLCCRGANSTYKIMVGRSSSINGPYVDKDGVAMTAGGGSLVLAGNSPWAGPGHPFVYQDPDAGAIVVFHAYEMTTGTPYLHLNALSYDTNGWPIITASTGGSSPSGGGSVYFNKSLSGLTSNNTGMDDSFNSDPNWGWSSWHNDPDRWGHVSDMDIHGTMYSDAATRWYMYHEPWFNDNDPKNCPVSSFTNPYGETHTHPFDDSGGHRCIGFSNNTDAQVKKQIDFLKLSGMAGVNINVYGRDHAGGVYNQVTQRFVTLGKAYSPQFEVMLNEDGGGSRICARGGSWSGTGAPNTTACHDPFYYNSNYSATELRNTNCPTLPWLDPNTQSVTVSNDQATCLITKNILANISYYYDHYFFESNYAKDNGRPIMTFFGDETIQYNMPGVGLRTVNPDRAWLKQMTTKYFGNPVFLYRQSSGFSKPGSDGSYAWTVHEGADAYTPNSTYFSSFYTTGKNSGKIIMGAVNPSFDNHEAGWGSASTLHRTCGKTFLFGVDQINAAFNNARQLPYGLVATLNDHEEGSGIEMGLETCWRISSTTTTDGAPSISGTTMSWSLNRVDPDGSKSQRASDATIRTVWQFRIWATDRQLAADGSYRMGLLTSFSALNSTPDGCYTVNTSTLPYTYSMDLRCYISGLTTGTYYFYVEMVGITFMQNRMSQSTVAYSVQGSGGNNPPIGNIDSLMDQSDGDDKVARGGTLTINGWAADPDDGSPITKIEIYEGATLLGTATKGIQRPDIASAFGRGDYISSGWTFNYTIPGNYTLGSHTYSAKLYDAKSLTNTVNSGSITILDLAPTAVMSLTPTSGNVPLTVSANTGGSSAPNGHTIASRQIDWGDGSGVQSMGSTTAQHTYTRAGTFTVVFTVTDSAGGMGRTTGTVTVGPPIDNYVSIDSLQDGAYVYTPMRVASTASVLHGPVTKMEIYVDGVLTFSTIPNVNPATIDKYVFAAANNTHVIQVTAYDSDGNAYSQSVNVMVIGVK